MYELDLSIFLSVNDCENLILNQLLVDVASASRVDAMRHLNYPSYKLRSVLKCNSISFLRKRREIIEK
jgi:hypothetical protein